MSHLLARIMLALLMVPLASIIYMVSFMVLAEKVLRFRHEVNFVICGVVSGAFVAIYWVLLWRRSVRWTSGRVTLTLSAAGAAVAAGTLVGVLCGTLEEAFGAFIWAPVSVFLWLLFTVLVWQETGAERGARLDLRTTAALLCPRCGYNMTGLRQSTCPECGAAFTIDELVGEQPERQGDELEEPAPTSRW